jgi:uncharacterized protein YraI
MIIALVVAVLWVRTALLSGNVPMESTTVGVIAATSTVAQEAVSAQPVSESNIPPATATPVVVATGPSRVRMQDVNLRDRPGVTARRITILRRGTAVEILGPAQRVDESLWIQVRAQGREGWVNQRYIIPAEAYQPDSRPRARVVGVSPDTLRIRANPSLEATVRGRISEGAEVAVIEVRNAEDGSWWRIAIDDLEGWASGVYLQTLP